MLLSPIPDKVLAAFAALEHDNDFQTVMREYLVPSREALNQLLRTLDGAQLTRAQGAAQALDKIIENTEQARHWLQKRRTS